MRGIVLIVGLLAATKVGYQEYAERSALTEVLLNTYRQDATESCRREAQQRNFRMPDWAWSAPKDIHISIGRSGDSEPYWQLGYALMSTRTARSLRRAGGGQGSLRDRLRLRHRAPARDDQSAVARRAAAGLLAQPPWTCLVAAHRPI